MRKFLLILAFLVVTPASAQTALDAATCSDRDSVISKLEARFGEAQSGTGIVSENRVLELWQSPETGSWTILMTTADGTTCIVAAGSEWAPRELKAGDPT